jgi:hypothetical protein
MSPPYIETGAFKDQFDEAFNKALGRPPADEKKIEEPEDKDDEAKPPVSASE